MIPVTVAERVRAVIQEQLGVEIHGDEEQLNSDLRADSLDVVDVQLALEQEFKIDIPYNAFDEHMTVGAVVGYVELRLARRTWGAPL